MPVILNPPNSVHWNDRPLTITAKVDVVRNPSDALLWEHHFLPALRDALGEYDYSMNFDGTGMSPYSGDFVFEAGTWRITAESGEFDTSGKNVVLRENGVNLFTFDAPNQEMTLEVPYGQQRTIEGMQVQSWFVATIRAITVQRYTESGELLTVTQAGDQLTVACQYQPRAGLFSARAKVYDAAGTVQATSNDLTLAVIAGGGGGGS